MSLCFFCCAGHDQLKTEYMCEIRNRSIRGYLIIYIFPLNYFNSFNPPISSPKLSYKFPLNLASFHIIATFIPLYTIIFYRLSFHSKLSFHVFSLIVLFGFLVGSSKLIGKFHIINRAFRAVLSQ